MSFVVRQISRTADGREIIRPKTFDGTQLIVGRDPASDIHLPDLAVTLRHAVIQSLGGGSCRDRRGGGYPFDVDGRQTERAEVNSARGAIVRMGSHVLTFGRGEGEEAGRVAISVERVGAVSDASESKTRRAPSRSPASRREARHRLGAGAGGARAVSGLAALRLLFESHGHARRSDAARGVPRRRDVVDGPAFAGPLESREQLQGLPCRAWRERAGPCLPDLPHQP